MITSNDVAELIKFYPVLAELSPGLQLALVNSAYPVQAKAGEIIFDVDLPIRYFLLLTAGSIRVTRSSSERELLLYRIRPGEGCTLTIGHLLCDIRYPARAQVESDISGVALPLPLFRQMMDGSPPFSTFLFQSLAGRLSGLLDLLDALTSLRLDQRLAALLLSRGPVIQATHSQLADELGSVREVISRILNDFKARGLIELERGQIRVIDPESLQKISPLSDPGH